MKQQIVLATSNPGKVREFNALLAPVELEVVAQSHWQVPSAEETGITFVENALIKARHASQWTGLPAIAEDSGICVEALHGAPGIYSARYAGEGASDQANLDKLLESMIHVPAAQRGAFYYSAIVFLNDPTDPTPIIVDGLWHGSILFGSQGNGGFGYDPVFHVPSHHCSSAELSMEEKNRLSHRSKALHKLLAEFKARHTTTM